MGGGPHGRRGAAWTGRGGHGETLAGTGNPARYLRGISGTRDEAGPSPSGKLMKVFKVTRKHNISVPPLPLVQYFQMLLNVLERTGKHVLYLKENNGQRDM